MTHPPEAEYPPALWQDILLIPVGIAWLGLLIVSAVIGVLYWTVCKLRNI